MLCVPTWSTCHLRYCYSIRNLSTVSIHTSRKHLRDPEFAIEPVHEISNNLVCATSKASDQPAHTRSLIRAFACRLSIL